MAKVCEEEFPEGSYKGQRGAGFFIDDLMKENLDLLARNIKKDMQFVGLYTGDGTVRNGKSTCAMQHAFYYSKKVSEVTKTIVPFTIKNIVFNSDDLISKALKLPKYSCIILDEGDDLTAHYFSELSMKLKKFFRKCGQLNLFIILILPDFFEIPKSYAIVRSNYLCNIKFCGEFERGFFDFYGPKNKKQLWLHGKKSQDYDAWQPDFDGRFIGLYTINEEEYRHYKMKDLQEDNDVKVKPKKQIEHELKVKLFGEILKKFPEITQVKLSDAFGISRRQGARLSSEYRLKYQGNKDITTVTDALTL